ncbi:MAG: cyanophycinase [Actinomycetota bacterium]|jgi:cyanophycinase|nr:cyanophycinase [Actinomycetota bacterium]
MTGMTVARNSRGTLALLGGGEWHEGARPVDEYLLEVSGATEIVVLPTASAFERPERVVDRCVTWFEGFGVAVRPVMVLNRRDAQDDANVKALKGADFVYLSDGSPLHLRSVLKGSSLLAVLVAGYRSGAVLAASGAGATVLGDPMVDPRGGAYTVGLGVVSNLAIFPYHGSAADHLRQRSIELLADHAILAGVDEHTALVRPAEGPWRAVGEGAVTLYSEGRVQSHHDTEIDNLNM